MEFEMKVAAFRALGDPTRLGIIDLLATQCDSEGTLGEDGSVVGLSAGEVCCQLTGADKITSTISHHLHELESAGLVELTKQGRRTVCRLNGQALGEISGYLGGLAAATGRGCLGGAI